MILAVTRICLRLRSRIAMLLRDRVRLLMALLLLPLLRHRELLERGSGE